MVRAKIVAVGLFANLPYATDSIEAQVKRELNYHRFPDALVQPIFLILVVSVFPDTKDLLDHRDELESFGFR